LLEELAKKAEVSISTVRRDLAILETAGNVRRTHGGARVVNPRSDEFTFSARDTTVYHVARYLENRSPQILTNSLPVANFFASANRVEVVVSGGVIYPRLGVLVGPLAVEAFSKIHADMAIMSAGGITPEGVTNSHGLLIEIQRAMIHAAQRVIFCIDHTKFGRKSISPMCALEVIDTIVTDSDAPGDLVAALRARDIEVVVAAPAGADPAAGQR